ncbi:MAG: helix-turn-helix domain-containing protein [Lachnospiraceae bacterium]|nr:helix-turn-helix domain-containing protein [Lachnospiraceae bacterium]MDE6626435.1 helix-turn-helix domain-containing protein [Lachnospiraceae bacterium]
MKLGKKIYTLRTNNGLTQEQLAEQLGVSRQSISKYEYDQSTPELEKIKLLAEIFGVTPDYLINDEIDIPKNDTNETTLNQNDSVEESSAAGTNVTESTDSEQAKKDSDFLLSSIEEFSQKTDALQSQYNHLNKTTKTICILTAAAMLIITIMLSATNIYQSSLISTLQQNQNTTDYYTGVPDIEEDLVDQIFSTYEYGIKKYNPADNTVDFFIRCKPIKYSTGTTISAFLSFENGQVYDYTLSENTGIFSGSITIPLTADDYDLTFLIDNQEEKQNIDVSYMLNLLDELDWHPSITKDSAEAKNSKNGTTTLSGDVCIQSDDSNDPTMFLPFISDIKLVFCMEDHIIFEHALTQQQLEDIQMGYGVFIPYEFNIDSNLLDQQIDIYVEYKNSNIDKNIRIHYNWLTEELTTDILPIETGE